MLAEQRNTTPISISREKTRLLYAALPASLLASLVLSLILAATQWPVVDHPTILLWFLLFAIVSIARLFDLIAYRKDRGADMACDDACWLLRFRIGVTSAGLTWAVAAQLLLPPDNIAHQSLLAFVMAGLGAGAMTSMAVDRRSVLLFVLPTLISLVTALLLAYRGGEPQLTMALMLLIYLFFVLGSSSRVERTMHENLQLHQVRQQKEAVESQIHIERELFAGGPVAVFVWSPEPGWPVEYVSRNVVDILGYTREQMMASEFDYASLIHGKDLARVVDEVEQHLASGVSQFEQSYRMRTRDDEYRWFYSFTMPERDAAGGLLRIRGYMFDQSEIYQAQESIRHTSAMLASVLEAASEVAIIATDRNGAVTLFNRGAELMLGYEAREVLHGTVLKFYRQEEITRRAAELTSEFAEPVSGFRVFSLLPDHDGAEEREWTLLRKDGTRLLASLVVTAMHSSEGECSGYLGIARDITAIHQMQRMKDEFISTVSHELRTPLTSICGSLSLLESGAGGELSPRVQQLVSLASDNSKRLGNLINDLLDMEEIVIGQMQLDMAKHALRPLLQQAIENNRGNANRCGVLLHLDGELDDVAMVSTDSKRLLQVLDNLLSNAIKYSPPGGTVSLDVVERDGRVRITVADSGDGIPPEFQSMIFQKFTQADSSDTRRRGGTGLGLAISKALIEKMGGEIGFFSPPGQGARFWVELPGFEPETALRQ